MRGAECARTIKSQPKKVPSHSCPLLGEFHSFDKQCNCKFSDHITACVHNHELSKNTGAAALSNDDDAWKDVCKKCA